MSIRHLMSVVALATALCASAPPAAAAPVAYNFNTGYASYGASTTFTSSGYTLTASALANPGGGFAPSTLIQHIAGGLGVCTSGADTLSSCGNINGNQLRVEGILFDFGRDVATVAIEFVLLNNLDYFSIYKGNASNAVNTSVLLNANGGAVTNPLSMSNVNARYLFVQGSSSNPADFRINSLQVEFVPEPGSLALVGLALAGLGAAGARRRRA